MKDIYLRSSDGTDEFCLRIRNRFTGVGSNAIAVAICRLNGLAYDRLDSVSGEPISDRDKDDYDVSLSQIVIQKDFLLDLSTALSNWNDDRELFEVILSDANEQKMTISIGLLDDFICEKDRPVAIIRYSVHRIAIESRFVVDGSSMTSFENEVNQAIALLT